MAHQQRPFVLDKSDKNYFQYYQMTKTDIKRRLVDKNEYGIVLL